MPFLSASWCLHLQCVSAAAWAVQLALHSPSGLYPKAQTPKEGRSSLLCAGHGLYRDTCCVLTRTVWRHLLCGGHRLCKTFAVCCNGLCADTCSVQTWAVQRHLLCADTGCAETLCARGTRAVWDIYWVCRHRLCGARLVSECPNSFFILINIKSMLNWIKKKQKQNLELMSGSLCP